MSIDQGKYICAYTDFGFKRLFGSELNKDIFKATGLKEGEY